MRRQITEEELLVFHTAIGKGIWMLQNVEDALHVYIVLKTYVKRPGSVTESEAEAQLAKQRAHPLGRSLGIAEKGGVLSSELYAELKEFKEERDWLVHRSIQDRADLYLDEKREALIVRIMNFSEWALRIQKMISEELVAYGASVGVSPQWVASEGQKILNKLKGIEPT
jgi:hypothetical protein